MLVYIAMYNPCKSEGQIKKYGFGPKAQDKAQHGFVKTFFDDFDAHCAVLKGESNIF
jgi:hypothetical protein